MMGYWNGYGYGMGFNPIGDIFSWVLFALFIVLVVLAVRYVLRSGHGMCHHHRHGGALATLRERYARGEIDTKEFEERKNALLED